MGFGAYWLEWREREVLVKWSSSVVCNSLQPESLNAPAVETGPEQPLTLRAAPKAAVGPGLAPFYGFSSDPAAGSRILSTASVYLDRFCSFSLEQIRQPAAQGRDWRGGSWKSVDRSHHPKPHFLISAVSANLNNILKTSRWGNTKKGSVNVFLAVNSPYLIKKKNQHKTSLVIYNFVPHTFVRYFLT